MVPVHGVRVKQISLTEIEVTICPPPINPRLAKTSRERRNGATDLYEHVDEVVGGRQLYAAAMDTST